MEIKTLIFIFKKIEHYAKINELKLQALAPSVQFSFQTSLLKFRFDYKFKYVRSRLPQNISYILVKSYLHTKTHISL